MSSGTPPSPDQVLEWDVATWAPVLDFWEGELSECPLEALAIGERNGGLSLWLASLGFKVVCTDIDSDFGVAAARHELLGWSKEISYQRADVLDLPFREDSFSVVALKSVLGALGDYGLQKKAIGELHRVLRPGGRLLFAENASASPLHRFFRNHFVAWGSRWRYLHWPSDIDLFARFEVVRHRRVGLLACFGRTESQRRLLAAVDRRIMPLVPKRWRYVVYGVAVKGPANGDLA